MDVLCFPFAADVKKCIMINCTSGLDHRGTTLMNATQEGKEDTWCVSFVCQRQEMARVKCCHTMIKTDHGIIVCSYVHNILKHVSALLMFVIVTSLTFYIYGHYHDRHCTLLNNVPCIYIFWISCTLDYMTKLPWCGIALSISVKVKLQ